MADQLVEVQIDGLPGPTHTHSGLSAGNVASQAHAGASGSPRAAALASLAKMRAVVDLGMPVMILPPLARPDLAHLRRCGFAGDDAAVLAAARTDAPDLLRQACSSAFMWTANAATIVPAADSTDGRLHAVVANLSAMPHRSLEAAGRFAQLTALLAPLGGIVHPALPAHLGDEGAANAVRLSCDGATLHILVHGRAEGLDPAVLPRRHPARQSLAAGHAIARLARPASLLHVRQAAEAIDAGAFHNDVVCVGARDRLLIHARAWADQGRTLDDLRRRLPSLRIAEISEHDLSLDEAIGSYLFNSLLLPAPEGWILVAPGECAVGRPRAVADRLIAEGFIARLVTVPLRESMMGGGGPACLRLRLDLPAAQLGLIPAWARADHARLDVLEQWVRRHYRERLRPEDLGDPALPAETTATMVDYRRITGAPA
jgi:succinylarginine dihydrolase